MVKATKALLDTKNQFYRACTSLINAARMCWQDCTVPYPVEKIRLIRRDRIDEFNERMENLKQKLLEAGQELDGQLGKLKTEAKERLGELYNEQDYPEYIGADFTIRWEYPSVEPPDYLKELNPELWEQEQQRISARFAEAVELAEQAFAIELQQLVEKLHGQLVEPEPGEKKKKLTKSAVTNLNAFLEKFKTLSIGSNDELNQLVEQAENAIAGVDVGDLRKDDSLKSSIRDRLSGITDSLSSHVIEQPTRDIELD